MILNPYFSIIMPTYNRAEYLRLAVESVLSQTFDDFEIIISNGGSTDHTNEVIAGFDDPRIRYLESETRLSIGDNYQNGLDNARGEYITFLSDDDAFLPSMLERTLNIIKEQNAEMVGFRFSNYYQDDYIEYDGRSIPANSLAIENFTGKTHRFSPVECINFLFGSQGLNKTKPHPMFITPYLANAVYHKEIFSIIRRRNKKMFSATPADMYLAAAVFFVIKDYVCLDRPLHVWSRWAGNATASPREKGDELKQHYKKLLNGKPLSMTPLQITFPLNCSINAILEAKADFKDKINIDVDWSEYFVKMYKYLLELKDCGIDVLEEFAEYKTALLKQNTEIKENVIARTTSMSERGKRFMRDNVPYAKNILQKLKSQKDQDRMIVINGDDANFTNFLEAAIFLENYQRKQ